MHHSAQFLQEFLLRNTKEAAERFLYLCLILGIHGIFLCMYTCIPMYAVAHGGSQPCVVVLRRHPYCIWDKASQWCPFCWSAGPPLSTSQALGLQQCIHHTRHFTWVPGIKLKPLCLQSKHFTNWAVFPAPGMYHSTPATYGTSLPVLHTPCSAERIYCSPDLAATTLSCRSIDKVVFMINIYFN